MSTNSIVDYRRPPVIETVVGLQFGPIPSLKNGHLGAFWKTLGPEWSRIRDGQPIEMQFERFGQSREFSAYFNVGMLEPKTRLLIDNQQSDKLIQVQNGRLHLNWIGTGGAIYPRYGALREEFLALWQQFSAFVQQETQAPCDASQWEVTYVNRIPEGTVWNSPADFSRVFRFISPFSNGEWGPLESVTGEWSFEIAPQRGRLHVQMKQEQLSEPRRNVVNLTLTARGPIDLSKGWTIESGLDLGRSTIVTAFTELTTAEAHAYWEKQ